MQLTEEVGILLKYGADIHIKNKKKVSAADFIYAKNDEDMKLVLVNSLDAKAMEHLRTLYSERKLAKLRKNLKITVPKKNNEHIKDTLANTTKLSDTSYPITPIESSYEERMGQSIEELEDKILKAEKKVGYLRSRNASLKDQLTKKSKAKPKCADAEYYKRDFLTLLFDNFTKEMKMFSNWINDYHKASRSLVDDIEKELYRHLMHLYGPQIALQYTGSHANGLHMPWSAINFLVKLPAEINQDEQKCQKTMKKAVQLSNVLKDDKKLVETCMIEDNSSLIMIKLRLSKHYGNKNVELIFKYFHNSSYPSNEDLIGSYLQRYPVSKTLYLIFRALLHRVGLDDPSQSGLKSCVIFMLVVAYLQVIEHSNAINIDTISQGQIFINMLFFYGYNFNYLRDYIQCRPIKHTALNPVGIKDPTRKLTSLMVSHPYNQDIILTKIFKRTNELKQYIKLLYIELFNRCHCNYDVHLSVTPSAIPSPYIKCFQNVRNKTENKSRNEPFKPISATVSYRYSQIDPKRSSRIDSASTNCSFGLEFESMWLPQNYNNIGYQATTQKNKYRTPLHKLQMLCNYNFTSLILN